jgi:hypothetical protein
MSFYFTFTTLEDIKELKLLINFMASYNLGYPHYDGWIQKTENQLERGDKQAILAFNEGKLVGNLVYQVCRDNGLGNLREIKNCRIHPKMKDRYFATFMLKQLYTESKEKFDGLICDVRANQEETYNFLICNGFIPITKIQLYEKNMDETIMFRPLKENSEYLKPKIKKILQLKSF